jgi:uncharacterized protein (TIGR02118 family)
MIKMAITLLRNDMTLEEQQRWWVEEHAPIARQVPGLAGYVIYLAKPEGDTGDAQICGTDDMIFETWEDAERAFASPEWAAARAHTAETGGSALRAWIGETVHIIE